MFNSMKALTLLASVTLVASSASEAQVFYARSNADLNKATQAMMNGELETASRYFGRAVRKDIGKERLVPALNNYCAVEYALGNLENAEKVCTRAIRLDRHFWRAYVNRGNVRTELGHDEGAHEDYAKAVRLKPSSRIARNALARADQKAESLLAQAGN